MDSDETDRILYLFKKEKKKTIFFSFHPIFASGGAIQFVVVVAAAHRNSKENGLENIYKEIVFRNRKCASLPRDLRISPQRKRRISK